MFSSKKLDSKHSQATGSGFFLNFVLGGVAGCISKTMVAPTERIKLIMQTQSQTGGAGILAQPRYSGMVDCLQKVVKKEGVINLWKGNGVNSFKIFPMNAFSLALKDFFGKRLNVKYDGTNKARFLGSQMLSGGLAGAVTISLIYPLDFVRTKLSTDVLSNTGERQYKGMLDCFKQVVQKDGVRGVYAGISTALTGVFLYKALSLGVYDYLKKTKLQDPKIGFLKKFAIANMVMQTTNVLLYPLDTIGRSLIVQAGNKAVVRQTVTECTKSIWKKEGIKGFYRGLKSDMVTGIGGSLILVLYDDLKKLINPASASNSH